MNNVARIRRMCLGAMFLAMGWILPFLTGQIHSIGNMLCPMHLPVMLSGFILGPMYGLLIGAITPLTRTMFFGMPVLYPFSICMSLELATYGLLCGSLYKIFNKKCGSIVSTYVSLCFSIIGGRIIWGISRFLCGLVSKNLFTWTLFINGGFISAWPGIIIQFILIPLLIKVLVDTKIINKFNCFIQNLK